MKKRLEHKKFDHSGSTFESFLEDEDMREEVEAVAVKRVLAWQLTEEMRQQKKTKQAMAKDLHTSRSQLDRLLDPRNVSVSLDTMMRAAHVLGKSLTIRIGDRKANGTNDARIVRKSNASSKRSHVGVRRKLGL